ncbi:DUF305 domain-containing protein [Ideonella azotifigens]|nr:DUF305 domain-containing protein [Ideonella azotifigens]MCD2341106.1 DUF305 domain-containing protein [Ideonella azotifigens]
MLASLLVVCNVSADSPQAAFAAENDAAMARMMDGMALTPSGDIDRDFALMMIPHHQGAIDMALSELRYGHNEQLRRIAQEIIVEQQQEIAAMHLALGLPLPPSAPAPTQGTPFLAPAVSAAPAAPAGAAASTGPDGAVLGTHCTPHVHNPQ